MSRDASEEAGERQPLLGPPVAAVDAKTGLAGVSSLRAAACLFSLGLLIMLHATNMSIMTVTSSEIAADLDAFEEASWFTSAYLIAASSTGPLYGKLAGIFSPRVPLALSAVLLATGTLLTSMSTDFNGFIIGRVVSGAAGSGAFTVSLIIGMELASKKRRGLVIGATNCIITLGVSIGAIVAGALLPRTGWRPLFWIQTIIAVVFGSFSFFATPKVIGSKKIGERSFRRVVSRLDIVGAVTLTLSLVLLLYAVSSPTSIPITPIIASAVVLAVFVPYEIYVAPEPIVPIALLSSRGLFFTSLTTIGMMMSRWSVLFFLPTWSIAVRGWAPSVGGATLLPTNLGFAAGGLLSGWLHIRAHRSFFWPALTGCVLFPLTLLLLSFVSSPTTTPVLPLVVVFFNGLITGATVNYSFAHVLFLTPDHTHYMVTSLTGTVRGFAGSFASAAGWGYFIRALREALTKGFADRGVEPEDGLIRRLLGSPALVQQLTGPAKDAAIEGYNGALRALWQGAAVFAFAFVVAQASVGWKAPLDEDTKTTPEEDGETS